MTLAVKVQVNSDGKSVDASVDASDKCIGKCKLIGANLIHVIETIVRRKMNRMMKGLGLSCWVALAIALSGCAGLSGGGGGTSVGPGLSSSYGKDDKAAQVDPGGVKIDVVVPVFDPNLPADSDKWEKLGIYPELRRAEANRFALKMKEALVDTRAFGAVRVAPSVQVTGDLYVLGKIIESNGEDVKINIIAQDISGRQWLNQTFSHRVKSSFHENIRNKGKDSYSPLFEKAAKAIVKKLSRRKDSDLAKLQRLSEVRFAASLSEESFAEYLGERNGRVYLTAAPADEAPMLQRVRPLRVRDQLFIDDMQTHYADFNQKLDKSYLVWQEQSLLEAKGARKAKRKSVATGVLGGLLLVGGLAADLDNALSDDYSVGTEIAAGAATVAGAVLIGSSIATRGELKVHRQALAELGRSLDIELAPQVVEYENQTAKLVGDAAEQQTQWIAFLREMYRLESTPDKAL